MRETKTTHAKEYVRWVYFDQGTFDSGKASECQPAYQADATFVEGGAARP